MSPERASRQALPRAVVVGRLRRRHALPFPGRILVEVGDTVAPGQIWCRGRLRSGVVVVDLPRLLQVQPDEVADLLAVEPGDTVEAETVLAGTPGRLRTSRTWLAPTRGVLAEVNARTGVAVFVRGDRDTALYCRLGGDVVSTDPEDGIVVEGEGVAVAGALGGGGRAYGPFRFVESGERARCKGRRPGTRDSGYAGSAARRVGATRAGSACGRDRGPFGGRGNGHRVGVVADDRRFGAARRKLRPAAEADCADRGRGRHPHAARAARRVSGRRRRGWRRDRRATARTVRNPAPGGSRQRPCPSHGRGSPSASGLWCGRGRRRNLAGRCDGCWPHGLGHRDSVRARSPGGGRHGDLAHV